MDRDILEHDVGRELRCAGPRPAGSVPVSQVRAGDVTVVESTPPGVFDDAAQTAVRKWIYEPRKENGVAVPTQAKARLVFDAAD